MISSTVSILTPSKQQIPLARALQRATAMSSHLPLSSARLGDSPYAHFPGQAVEKIAWCNGEVIGYVHGDIHVAHLQILGKECLQPALYFGDLRVSATARRLGVASRLLDALAEEAITAGAQGGYCLVNEGNDAMVSLLESGRSRLHGHVLRRFTTATRLCLTPARKPGTSRYVRIDPTRVRLDALMNAFQQQLFSPSISQQLMQHLLAHHACHLHCFATREKTEQLAFLVWNQFALRQFCVLESSMTDRVLTCLWQSLIPFTGGIRPPSIGEGWHAAETGWLSVTPDADMIAQAIYSAWALRAHFVNVPAIAGVTKGLLWRSLNTDLVVFGIDGHPAPQLPPTAIATVDLTRT